ncbi:MAG: hypothetical protein HYU39_08780 [Thaumarchaeota archaeon]|nr:hypothetical protein [Nitrososphaerota archaeon]
MQEETFHLASGLKRFYSVDQIRSYIQSLSRCYQGEATRYGDWLGDLLRKTQQNEADKAADKPSPPKGGSKPVSKGWVKMGSMQINTKEPLVASAEVLFDVLDEFKLKLSRAEEALKSLADITNLSVPEDASYILCMKDGLVERLIVDTGTAMPSKFNFTAKFTVLQKREESSA